MTTAFVLNNETILCHQTLEGWQPLQVVIPDIKLNSTAEADIYQIGRVELLASLAPNNWYPEDNVATEPTVENNNLPATSAITYHYARNNHIALPTITDDCEITATLSTLSNEAVNIAFISYRQLITQLPVALAAQISQAIQLLRWQADTQFCSRCSAPVSTAKCGERAMVCQVCRLRQYPRVQPCVITAITRPNPQTGEMQILLAHHHRYGQQSLPLQYGLIAGFVEVGESLEHAVVREVGEEVGISLTNIRYVSSQPWPFPSNLMLGFRASYAGGEIVIQEDELSHADFFDISNLPKIPFKGSIAYDLIAQIMNEQGMSL
ncbi:NAD(+) diphosphatase [Psychrobacter sp. CAL346-MNA-CIBAN-0220]|uniref:NAD(+) diphosphatase n=1 Tax=Psychrobacter sp. CAL346-MNA-CIBAN-0220 TaxID=3140457 RepID=UPI00331A0375